MSLLTRLVDTGQIKREPMPTESANKTESNLGLDPFFSQQKPKTMPKSIRDLEKKLQENRKQLDIIANEQKQAKRKNNMELFDMLDTDRSIAEQEDREDFAKLQELNKHYELINKEAREELAKLERRQSTAEQISELRQKFDSDQMNFNNTIGKKCSLTSCLTSAFTSKRKGGRRRYRKTKKTNIYKKSRKHKRRHR